MHTLGIALFDTAIGRCGIAWSEAGVTGVYLPAADDDALRRHMRQRFGPAPLSPPSAQAQRAIEGITTLLDGGGTPDLQDVALDMHGIQPFHRRVYELAREIPPGRTLTYGEIAAQLEDPGAARAVGQALGRNPFAIVVPCHRVLAAGTRHGGFSAPGGVDTKLRILAIEGARRGGEPDLFD